MSMIQNFFVLGLPRSRTAWLANFLTYERHCYHEGLNGCKTVQDYKNKLGNYKGDSSTGLMLAIDINKEFPTSPKVIIESDGEKATNFIRDEFGYCHEGIIELFQSKLDKVEGLRIHLNDIDDNLELIWHHLIGTPLNKGRAELLKGFDIKMKNTHEVTRTGMELWKNLNKS